MALLERLGYQFNDEALREQFQQAGIKLSPCAKDWFEAAAPYMVLAYEQGREGKSLSKRFPFLEEVIT